MEEVAEQPKQELESKPEANGKIEWESDEGRKQRAEMCGKGVRDLLEKYECILMVPTIDISTGRFIPIPEIRPAARKMAAPTSK